MTTAHTCSDCVYSPGMGDEWHKTRGWEVADGIANCPHVVMEIVSQHPDLYSEGWHFHDARGLYHRRDVDLEEVYDCYAQYEDGCWLFTSEDSDCGLIDRYTADSLFKILVQPKNRQTY